MPYFRYARNLLPIHIDFFHVDAFIARFFGGNPAAVCILEDRPPEETVLRVAGEFFLPETAFCVREAGTWRIRWFTPEIEMDICGHTAWRQPLLSGTSLILPSCLWSSCPAAESFRYASGTIVS